ncbi:MAG: filamentous hemagglutinin N-terminal domain-containing protein, partial [Methylococcales bacterium]|nr:filamentous hemagglutinin N-terminal domain-containing protein [Methylococcales bacterium]
MTTIIDLRKKEMNKRDTWLLTIEISLLCCITPLEVLAVPIVNELPSGGQIVAGSGTISQTNNKLTLQQNSNRLITNWNTFNIGSRAEVNFQQPSGSSIALNRVTSQGASHIYGRLNANGQVFLINPSGVLFARGAQVDVGGIVASTLNISNENFLNGNIVFENNGHAGDILSQGEITALSGGYVALIAPRIQNEGDIKAPDGTVALGSGNKVTLNFASDNLINLTVDQGTIDALIENKSLIQAQNGVVILSAKALDTVTRSVVSNSGIIEATGAINKGGRILLTADEGSVSVLGTLDASSTNNQGGEINLTADSILLKTSSQLNAKGATGGGEILVGGDWQGSGDMHQASTVTMEQGAKIDASATQKGDGGKVVLWSDINNAESITTAKGEIKARGGIDGGDGGQIETSGHTLDAEGIIVNAGADKGTGGLWLLDPTDSAIDQAIANTYAATLNTGTSVLNQVAGDITLNNGVNIIKTAGGEATLTLEATQDIILGDNSSISSSANSLNISLLASREIKGNGGAVTLTSNGGDVLLSSDTDASGGGPIDIANGLTINSNGGDITLGGGDATGSGYAQGVDLNSGEGIRLAGTVTFNSAGGDITLRGKSFAGGGAGVNWGEWGLGFWGGDLSINSGVGKILLDGVGQTDGTGSLSQGVVINGTTAIIQSASTSADAIKIIGEASVSTDGSNYGIEFKGASTKVYATGAGGGITLDAEAGSSGLDFVLSDDVEILASNGPIQLIGHGDTFWRNGTTYLGSKVGTPIATSTSNIFVTTDLHVFNGSAPDINTSGDFTWKSASTSFGEGVQTSWYNYNLTGGQTLNNLVIGNATNTSNITLGSAMTFLGDYTVYGNHIFLHSNLESTGAGNINLLAKGEITQIVDSAVSLTSAGGNVLLSSDTDASGGGQIGFNSGFSVATSGGNITLGGGDTSGSGYAEGYNAGNSEGIRLDGTVDLNS